VGDLPDVPNPVLCGNKKMEYRSIMPNVVRSLFQLDFGDVPDDPMHQFRSVMK
jgi:hypothetical protein